MRYNHQAFGHLQAGLPTVSRVGEDRWAFPEGRLLHEGWEIVAGESIPAASLCPQWLGRIFPDELRPDAYFPVASVR